MKNIVLLLLITLATSNLVAQCPGSSTCDSANVLCTIRSLQGFQCNNPVAPNPTFPHEKLCFGSGTPHNLQWWAFYGCGGPLLLEWNYNPQSCRDKKGIQAGVFEGKCDGSNVWDCRADCMTSTIILQGNTIPCETYYIWVNGCDGAVCQYSLSVNGADCAPSLPPLQPLTTQNRVCACNEFEVCAPPLGNCHPNYIWKVNGREISRDECVKVVVPRSVMAGQKITLCLTVAIGDPDSRQFVCDIDSICKDFFVEPIPKDTGECLLTCYEDQPFIWHGVRISSTCISPPCSTRAPIPSGCCVDSFKSFIFLPKLDVGVKDTFICDPGIPFSAENGKVYTDEVCEELIVFKKLRNHPDCPSISTMCDTSYLLSIGRFKYKKEWKLQCDSCSSEFTLSANIIQYSSCPKFDSIAIVELIWLDSTLRDTVSITNGLGSIQISEPGEYCVDVYASVSGKRCTSPDRECYKVTESDFQYPECILGDSIVCNDSISTYQLEINEQLCSLNWFVLGQGSIITPSANDSSTIKIKWDSLALDTIQICIDIEAMCYSNQKCMNVFICPKSIATTSVSDKFLFFYSIQNQSIYWSDLDDFNNIKLTILDLYGRSVLTTKIRDSEGRMNVSNLIPGVYIISLKNDARQIETLKCIIH